MHVPPPRRSRHPSAPVAAAVAILLMASTPRLVPRAVAQTTVGWRSDSLQPTDTWNTLSVEMRVAGSRVSKTGAAVGSPLPVSNFRIERSSATGKWKTVVTVLSIVRPPRYALGGSLLPPAPMPVVRIVDDEDGTPARAYDKDGNLLNSNFGPVTPAGGATTQPRSIGRGWIEGLVATNARRSTRQSSYEQKFGSATKVGTLSRYFRAGTDSSEEVLVDPKTMVTVEANSVQGGQLMVHRTFGYGAAPSQAVVRTSLHSETVVSKDTGDRAVSDTTFSNIRLERR